jgi:O-antigen biosynthesis protein WbqP
LAYRDQKLNLTRVGQPKALSYVNQTHRRTSDRNNTLDRPLNGTVGGVGRDSSLSLYPLKTHAPRPIYGMKRIMDVVVSGGLLLFLLPFLCVVWVMVRVTSVGPGLFWSRRVGIGGGIFMMPKFRTMPVGSPQMAREALGAGDGLTTSIGQFLRKLSIDELPQLWSVLVGDMSLVGPRPLLGNDPTTAIRQRLFPHCFGVRPGITGLAQVNGRNCVKPLAKARYDGFYAGHCSLGVDIKILLKTARAVFDVRRIL